MCWIRVRRRKWFDDAYLPQVSPAADSTASIAPSDHTGDGSAVSLLALGLRLPSAAALPTAALLRLCGPPAPRCTAW
eukprot:COSAG04_NODE_254_length_18809_cov_8.025869_9_plen_77_part_00